MSKIKLRVDMVCHRSVVVEVDEESYYNNDIDIASEISTYLNQGNIANDWEMEDPDYGVCEVEDSEKADVVI